MFFERKRLFITAWVLTTAIMLSTGGIFLSRLVPKTPIVKRSSAVHPPPTMELHPLPAPGHSHLTKRSPDTTPKPAPLQDEKLPVGQTIGLVAFVFVVSLAVLLALNFLFSRQRQKRQVIAPPDVQFRGGIKALGGSIAVTAAGSLGAFLTIAAATVILMLTIHRFM